MDYEEYLKQNPEFAARQKAKLSVNISVPEDNHNKRISPSTTAIALYIFGWIIYIIVALITSFSAGIFAKNVFHKSEAVLLAVILACAVSIFPSMLLFALGDIVKYLKIISEKQLHPFPKKFDEQKNNFQT